MKKFFALTTLLVAGSALAQSTSTTTVQNKKEKFLDKVSANWFGEAAETVVGDENQTKDVWFYHSVSLNYQATKNVRLVINPRFQINDATPGTNDKFQELDLRLRATGNIFSNRIWTAISYILPTSQATLDADNTDGQVRFYNQMTTDFNDFNSISYGFDLRKNFSKNTAGPESEYMLLPYLTYSNKSFSDNVSFRADYEGFLMHNAGKSLNNLTEASWATGQRFVVGPNFNKLLGMSVFPYLAHYPALPKAADQLGAGVQMFYAF